ncbi:MAG: DUF2141 domain-containing protein [Bacteroidales bacterium]|jgi:uncharacterized protein (DUF2141 family)
MRFIVAFLFIGFAHVVEAQVSVNNQKSSGIELILSNIRKSDGLIQIGVFRSEVGYPDKPSFNFSLAKDTIKNGTMRFFFPVDKTGPVSICILDDDNRNEKMDYVLGILPKEGFGFSNNPKISLRGAPSFSTTSFSFSGGIKEVSVRMVYMH